MKKQPRYEYVASALNYTGDWDHDYVDKVQISDWFSKIDGLHDHRVSILFNAYTEQELGQVHRNCTGANRVYADSGGLQMVTLGIGEITDELKTKVYETQSKFSDVAMIFDEIPIYVSPEQKAMELVSAATKKKSGIKTGFGKELNKTGSRVYDPTLLVPCAKKTAANILNQIQYFEKHDCDTKVLCILQGNSTDDYQRWFDTILSEIPKEEWTRIGGVAFGTPVYGNGIMEDVERAYFMNSFSAPDYIKKHFHLLGVGSVNRLLPYIMFRRNGVIADDVLLSYDSSKHTGGTIRGQYQLDFNMLQVYRHERSAMSKIDKEAMSFIRHILKQPDFTLERLHDAILLSKNQTYDKYGEGPNTKEIFVAYRFAMLMFSIYQATKAIDRCHSDDKYLHENVKNKGILGLEFVTNDSLFAKWKQHNKSQVASKKVQCYTPTSLEAFYD